MSRRPNSVKTAKITLSTTPQVVAYLERLVTTGLYGKNSADAAERLVARGIETLLRDREIPQK